MTPLRERIISPTAMPLFPDDCDRMLQRRSRRLVDFADGLLDWIDEYSPERLARGLTPISPEDEFRATALRRQAAAIHRATEAPVAAAIAAPTKTGQSLFLGRVLRPADKSSHDSGMAPRGTTKISNIVTRYTIPDRFDASALSLHPNMAVCMSRGDWLRVLASGFGFECEIPHAAWTEEALKNLVAKCGSQAAGAEVDAEWRTDLLDTYSYIRRQDRRRFQADEVCLSHLLRSHPLHEEGYVELAASLWWGGWPQLTSFFNSVLAFIENVQSFGRKGMLCHWNAARFLLEIQGVDDQHTLQSFDETISWSDFVDVRKDGWFVLDFQPGAGPPAVELSVVQAAVKELVLPILPEFLDNDGHRLLEQMDFLDFPGCRGYQPGGATQAESVPEQMSIVKRGKIPYLYDSYAETRMIDALLLLEFSTTLEARCALMELVRKWGRARFGEEWPHGVSEHAPALFVGMTGIDQDIQSSREVTPKTYNNRLNVVREMLMDVFTDFGGKGRPFTNVYPIRFPGTWDKDSEHRAHTGVDRWKQAERAFLDSEQVCLHVADPERRWQAAMADEDGGVGLITSAISRSTSAGHKQDALQRDIENTISQLIELANHWRADANDEAEDAATLAPGQNELLELFDSVQG